MTKKSWLIGIALIAASLLPVGAAQAHPSVQTWNLDADFLAHPDMNPGPDSYGNLGVWNYMQSATLKRDGNYTLLPNFTNDTCGVAGLAYWMAPSGLPHVAMNTNPNPVVCQGLTIPAQRAYIHPWSTRDAIVGWRSPISGTVHISGGVKDMNPGGGNGVKWFVVRGTTTIDKGSILNGGKQRFLKGLSTTISAGHFVYVIVDAWNQDFGYDDTLIRLTITG
jgi:hypothetical protein